MQLMELCLNNPNADKKIREFNKSAVRFLIKELKGSTKLLKELERAIKEKDSDSKCITIPAKSERRLLVAHRRCKPQVIYCRLWRWPDLQSQHQLKSACPANGGAGSSGAICINPYHYERIIPRTIDPVLVPCSKIPPDLSSSVEDSEPRKGRTKAWPASLSFIQRLGPYFSQQNQSERVWAQPEMRATDSNPARVEADHTMISADDTNPLSQEFDQQLATQQQFYQPQPPQTQPQTQPQPQQPQQSQQYQQPSFQPMAAPQQQYLQTQATPYQLQARDPTGRSQGIQFLKQEQQSHTSLLHQSPQYQANMSQGGIGPLVNQQKPLVAKSEASRTFRFRPKGFVGRVDQDVCHEPRFNGYAGNPYPVSSQRMPTQVAYTQPGVTQLSGMAVTSMGNSSLSPQLICSPTNNSYGATSTITSQPTALAQIPNTDYPTIYSPQQQYPAQEQTMQLGYQPDSAMSVAEQPSNFGCYGTSGTNQDQNDDHQMDGAIVIDLQEVPFIDDKNWCSITYHEYDQRIGEKYHSNSPVVSVDGFTQPMCNDRFCIGGISNVNRNQFTEWVRRRIGRGVKLTYVDGDVYVEGISESSMFVSSPLHDNESPKGPPDDLVVKLSPGCSARVFSTHEFGKLLHAAVAEGFEAVYKLTSRCVIKVSFVKGWGKNYKRQSIYNTPCWVEVQLNGPLQWIDKVLRQMRPPMSCCSTS